MATDVQVPALGESITEGTLAQWLKKPGEQVAEDEPIASLETDKVTVEVPSPADGVLSEQLVNEGETVAVGAVIARIDAGAAATLAPAKEAAAATTNQAGAGETPALRGDEVAPVAEPEVAQREAADDHITTLSPAVRRAVLEYHVDPSKIRGTGKDGRLTKDDVIAAAEAQGAEPTPAIAPQAKAPTAPAPAPAPQAKASTAPGGPDVAPPADRRTAPQGSAEHGSHADDVQRRRHVGRDGRPQPLQGSVREEAWHPPRLHELLREGVRAGGS
jgi:2-oxoglutarate dehydrogenase E2 component (dihydrolipoamide succinyltransferase)